MVVHKDDLSFRRVANLPKRNLGRRRMAFLEQIAEKENCTLYQALQQNLDDELFKRTKAKDFVDLMEAFARRTEETASDLLAALLDASGYERLLRTEGSQERLDNLAELKQSVYAYETSCGEEADIEHYLSHVALFTNSDAQEEGDRVKLMTVHAAKGLEFPYVFLCAMNEGIFPSGRTGTLPGMEEERRLAFVAVTRAQKRLFLSEAEGRNLDGAPRFPSRFLLDIGPKKMEYTAPPKDRLIREAREYIAFSEARLPEQAPQRLPAGRRVRHAVMGTGTIVAADEEKGAYIVEFDSLSTRRTISFRAKLEEI